jgi:hypothetical protein
VALFAAVYNVAYWQILLQKSPSRCCGIQI